MSKPGLPTFTHDRWTAYCDGSFPLFEDEAAAIDQIIWNSTLKALARVADELNGNRPINGYMRRRLRRFLSDFINRNYSRIANSYDSNSLGTASLVSNGYMTGWDAIEADKILAPYLASAIHRRTAELNGKIMTSL